MINTNRNVPAIMLIIAVFFGFYAGRFDNLWLMWASGFFSALFGITTFAELFWENVGWELRN
jgi:hypothetical protein